MGPRRACTRASRAARRSFARLRAAPSATRLRPRSNGIGAARWCATASSKRSSAAAVSPRAAAELARIGGRAPSTGELTPVERRVAELVAAGRTNKEVAGALYLSTRTVEGHLSRVYGKLGVHSRVELVRKLG